MATIDENFDVTQRASMILGEKLEKILSSENDPGMLQYQAYNGENRGKTAAKPNESHEQNLCYSKFPTHSQYMASDHMIDTQSLDPLQLSDLSEPTDSTLPDIVSELKSRNIFVGPMRERSDMDNEYANATAINRMIQNAATDSLSESLENDLRKMGLNWVTSMMKKTKTATQLSTSSESIDQDDKSARPSYRPRSSPSKLKSVTNGNSHGHGTNDKANDIANDSNSFVDKNIVVSLRPTESSRTTDKTEPDHHGMSMNLKDFLARELLKHSSSSSMSTDSSLGSIFLKSFLGRSLSASDDQPGTPKTHHEKDKHRTSTPVQQISGVARSSSTPNSRSETAGKSAEPKDNRADGVNEHDLTPRFFSGESHISSVGCSIDSMVSSDEQHKKTSK